MWGLAIEHHDREGLECERHTAKLVDDTHFCYFVIPLLLLSIYPSIRVFSNVLGASVRNSAHGKGHEEGGLAYAKA